MKKKKLDPWEKGWIAMVNFDIIHIVPVDDEKKHYTHRPIDDINGEICDCDPEPIITNGIPIWVHNAYDCREAVQQALEILDDLHHNHYNDDIDFDDDFEYHKTIK